MNVIRALVIAQGLTMLQQADALTVNWGKWWRFGVGTGGGGGGWRVSG